MQSDLMEALYLLVPLSVVIVALAAWIFLRMSDSGQFDDMEGPAHSILLDDDDPSRRGRDDRDDRDHRGDPGDADADADADDAGDEGQVPTQRNARARSSHSGNGDV